MNDFIADNPDIAFPLAALVCGLAGGSVLVLAWRSRWRHLRASARAVLGIALLFNGWRVAITYRMNRSDHKSYSEGRESTYLPTPFGLWTMESGTS